MATWIHYVVVDGNTVYESEDRDAVVAAYREQQETDTFTDSVQMYSKRKTPPPKLVLETRRNCVVETKRPRKQRAKKEKAAVA